MTARKWNYLMKTLVVVLLVAVIGFTFVACGKNNSTPVSGVYYYEAEGEEYQITLSEDFGFVLDANGEIRSGEYFGDGTNLRLVFGKDDETTATLKDGVFKLTYGTATFNMLQRVNYTVTFNTNGGNAVDAQKVLNGKTATKPVDPTRANDRFLGWYVDSAFSAPFNFDTQIITQDTTVYANWEAEDPNQPEFVVSFDANYQGAAAVASQTTYNGKLTALPEVTREGYEFAGWWASMVGTGDKLSYQCDTSYVFANNTTLYAMWVATTGVKQPVVTVAGNAISWTTTANAEYVFEVTGPQGFTAISKTTQANSEVVDFANAPAGEYAISVAAKVGQEQSAATVVYYVNKGLAMPEVWVAEPATLVYSQVPNAEKYIVTVECGSQGHQHYIDNGKSTTLPFANCEMKEGGIVFTVTAVANGYASATTTYVYNKVLAQVTGVAFDNATETLTWAQVVGATNYQVTVTAGQQTYTYNNGTSNSFSLKQFAQGEISVAIVAQSKGYNASQATTYTYNKATVATPSNIKVDGNQITWDVVEGATYDVKVGSSVYACDTASFDITTVAGLAAGTKYQVSVRAKAATTSSWSDAVTVGYQVLENVSYYANVATWDAVAGATKYKVKVTGASEFEVEGANYAPIIFTQAGANTIAVCFYNGSQWSNWVETTVQVYAVEFDARLGAGVDAVYVATGDAVDLAVTTRSGYDFAGWYNAPGGAAAGAYNYKDGFVYDLTTSTVLFAAWTPMKATVSYNFMGMGDATDFGTTTVTFGEGYTLKIPTPPSTAYSFGGWFGDIACRDNKLTDEHGNGFTNWDYYQPERTVYAKWYQLLTFTKLNDGTYRVKKGPDISKAKEVTIPAEFDGVAVTQIAGFAFERCYELEVINIPDTIKYIDLLGKAFDKCSRLKEVNVYHVEGNNEIVYKSDNGILLVYDKNGTQKLELGFVPATMQGTFEVPAGVEVIPEKLFAKSSITEITIPASVSIIEPYAFQNCASLKKVTFLPAAEGETPAQLTIGEYAFAGCKALEEITLPANLVSLATTESGEVTAFNSCIKLQNVFVAEGNQNYKNPIDKTGIVLNNEGVLVYAPNAITGTYTIPAGVTAIGPYAFAQAKELTEIVIPAWVTSVQPYAFYNATNLGKVTFEAAQASFGAVTIGEYAFANCAFLTEVVYQAGSNVGELGNSAFEGCSALMTLEIPATVTKVGNNAFKGCGARTATIADGENAITFGTGVYANCKNLYEITLPARVTALPEGAFTGCESLRNVKVDENNQILKDIDGVLFTKDGKELLFFSQVRGGDYAVLEGVEKIGAGVFQDNTSLTNITFGADVKEIGDYAFAGCTAISTVHIGANVTRIGKHAFDGCALNTVTFDQTGTEELVIDEYAFQKAISSSSSSFTLEIPARVKALGDYAFYSAKFYAVKFNEGLVTIGDFAFASNTSLRGNDYNTKTLAFPQSVTTVGNSAFYKCTALSILKLDTVENWGDEAFRDCTAISDVTFPTAWEVIPKGFMWMASSSGLKNFKGTVTIAKTVKQIEYRAFYNAFTYAAGLVFEEGGTADLVIGTKGKQDVRTGEWVDNGNYSSEAFNGLGKSNSSFKVVNLPDRLTIIGIASFKGASKITNFNISENSKLANIGEEAFSGCSALTSIFIPSTVVNLPQTPGYDQACAIGYRAFYNCNKMTTITFEKDATATAATAPLTLDSQAFYGCKASGFTTLDLPGRLTYNLDADGVSYLLPGMDLNTFNATYLKTITIDEGEGCTLMAENNIIYSVGQTHLYYAAPKLTGGVTIPKETTDIAKNAFKSNTGLTKIIFEKGGTADLVIGDSAFEGCTKITEAAMPERVVTIGSRAFYNCKLLPSIYVPASVTSIGSSAFQGSGMAYTSIEFGRNDDGTVNFKSIPNSMFNAWEGMTEWEVPEGVETVGSDFIANTSLRDSITKLTFPSTLTSINNPTTNRQVLYAFVGLTEVVFNNNNALKCEDGAIYTKDGGTLLAVLLGIERDEFVVAEGTAEVAPNAFQNTDIAKIVIASTVQKLNAAFGQSYVEDIQIKDGDIPLVLDGAFDSVRYVDEITIPARAVSMIHYPLSYSYIKKVSFAPNSKMETMGDIFCFAMGLEEIFIPKSVKTITMLEEFSTPTLKKVEFEEGSQLTEWGVLYGFLEAKLLPDKLWETTDINGDGVVNGDDIVLTPVEIINFPFETVLTYAEGSLANSTVTKANFAEGLTTIPANLFSFYQDATVFYRKNFVTEVTIPSTATSIGANAFAYTGITEVVLPEGLLSIGDGAFEGCKQLTSITWPSTLERIGKRAFKDCVGLTTVTLANTLVNGPDPAGSARDAELGLDDSAFENCVNLEQVTFTEGGTAGFSIGKYAFKNTPKLTSITFPERLVDGFYTNNANGVDEGFIREGAFQGSGLTEVVLPYSLSCKTLGVRAFADCASLTSVTLGYGIEKVSEYAFENCAKLEYAYLPASVKTFTNAFFGCDKVALDLDADNLDFTMVNGVMYNAAETAIIYVAKDASGEVNMPNSVKTVAAGAFKGIAGITSVKLSTALTVVEDYMFEGSGVTSVVIPASIKTIGKNAFKDCVNLQTVVFEAGQSNYLTIGDSAFENTALQQVEIPRGTTAVGNRAFFGVNATVTFAEGNYTDEFAMKPLTIGEYAFANNTALTTVTFPQRLVDVDASGTKQMAVGAYAFSGCTNLATVNFWTNANGLATVWTSYNFTIGNQAFAGTALQTLVVPAAVSFYSEAQGSSYNLAYFNGFYSTYAMDCPVDTGATIVQVVGPASPSVEAGTTKDQLNLAGSRVYVYVNGNAEQNATVNVTADMLNEFDATNNTTENKVVVVTGAYQGYSFAFELTVKPATVA